MLRAFRYGVSVLLLPLFLAFTATSLKSANSGEQGASDRFRPIREAIFQSEFSINPSLGLGESPDWRLTGSQEGSGLGTVVTTAGDVNGDGFSDFLASAPSYDNGEVDEGKVFLFLGSSSGPAPEPVWSIEGNQPGARIGSSVSTAGDVNGDGFADFLVGAPFFNGTGMVVLFLGSPSGPGVTPDWTAIGNRPGGLFGASIAYAGDVQGNGFDDFIVGEPGESSDPLFAGKVYLFPGAATGPPEDFLWTAAGDQPGMRFGATVGTAGDNNGDGYADLLIGAPGFRAAGVMTGKIFLFPGSPQGPEESSVWVFSGDQADAGFGETLGPAGDVDGDGYSDFLVGSPRFTGEQAEEGKAFLFRGSAAGPGTSPDWIRLGDRAGGRFGASVATAGDTDGDGFADMVIGAPGSGSELHVTGRALVFAGSRSGPGTEPAWEVQESATRKSFGDSVATAGDVNGDGFGDLLIGAPGLDGETPDSGQVLLYHGSAHGPTSLPDWSDAGGQVGAEYGFSLGSAGDVNGDGFDDVIAGAWLYDAGNIDDGKAFVFHGSRDGLETTPSWTADANQSTAGFGRSVAAAGDVNGDGFSDVIVGAYLYSHTNLNEGRAFVFHGSEQGLSAEPSWVANGNRDQAWFGFSVATAGDVNGDGFSDVLVSTINHTSGFPLEGRTSLFLGSRNGLRAIPSWSFTSRQSGARLGWAVATAGDVNGDGFSDVVTSTWLFDNGQLNEGKVFLFYGSLLGLSLFPSWEVEGNQDRARLGWSVGTAGDVNGDGFSDLIIGAPGFDRGEPNEGAAFLYLGSPAGPGSEPAWTAEGDQADSQFGGSVGTAGDINGDGFSDVIVGAWFHDAGLENQGKALVYLGTAAGLSPDPAWTGLGDQADARFGWAVGTAGDVNGDGFSDLLVSSPIADTGLVREGRVFLHLGNRGGGLDRSPRQLRTDGMSFISALGWSDSETAFRIRMNGRSPAGRGKIRLQREVLPAGIRFTGTKIIELPWVETGLPVPGIGSAAILEDLVEGLELGTPYHWRLRTRNGSPFFPHSPWVHISGITRESTHLRTAECRDLDGDGFGFPSYHTCPGGILEDCDDLDPFLFPGAAEVCDGKDNNCDQIIDRDSSGQPMTEICYTGPKDTRDEGICRDGLLICENGQFNLCREQTLPEREICGNLDLDCDGIPGNPGGDADGSGRVDGGDLWEWAHRMGTSREADPSTVFFLNYDRIADIDGDGDIDGVDLLKIMVDFGKTICGD